MRLPGVGCVLYALIRTRVEGIIVSIARETKKFGHFDKIKAKGVDIIDLGMGNPDLATPDHIVDKLVEAARKPQNHR